ncbi:ABC-type transport system, involved in lipoprotein release, permease component [Reichenbachiella faecimaris]|uniref:ABC-type transport system, involved in lipoprotein release, permease component n=1 Tax=Reichenbachiella faecimaris TaxID=692418 RepID=A0A1W2G8L5_REIFA|nr:FtsX-like permease family protein [Reichenbachiella faecimaris]SMD33030.1 ABC-type transport system, involved in lipoprotein release, permease component [Reichenbachiella faecimaris]
MRRKITLAWRNLWRNKKRTFITLASVTFAVVVATMMRGLQLGTYDKMLDDAIKSTTGHVALMDKLYWDDKTLLNSMEFSSGLEATLNADSRIDFWVPQLMSGVLVSSGPHTLGVLVQGVDPEVQDKQIGLADKIIAGEYLNDEDQAVLIGKELSQFLRMSVGDTLVLLGQGYMGVTAAAKYPIKGIFDHPMAEFNKRMIFLPLATAQYLFFMEGRLTNVNLVLKDNAETTDIQTYYESKMDTTLLEARGWRSMNREILSGIESDNFFGKIMISILYMVIGFGLFGTILMMTMERKKEFSIMIAIGMRRTKLLTQVILESIMIAGLGALAGLMISFPVVYFYYLNPIPVPEESAEMYRQMNMEPILQISIKPDYMLLQFAIVLGVSIVASIIPLNNILKFNIVDIIRGRQ